MRLYSAFLARVAPTPLASLRRRRGRCAGHRQRPTLTSSIQWMFDGLRFRVFGRKKARSGRAGRGGRAGPRTAFSSLGKRWPTPENPSPGLWLLKSNELRLYSALSASMHPIPLPALQKPAGGWFPAVLSVLRDLDVYAEGMSNGFGVFFPG